MCQTSHRSRQGYVTKTPDKSKFLLHSFLLSGLPLHNDKSEVHKSSPQGNSRGYINTFFLLNATLKITFRAPERIQISNFFTLEKKLRARESL